MGCLHYPDSHSIDISNLEDGLDLRTSSGSTRDTSPTSSTDSIEEISRKTFEEERVIHSIRAVTTVPTSTNNKYPYKAHEFALQWSPSTMSLDSDNISHLSLSSPPPDEDLDFEETVDAAEKYDAEGHNHTSYDRGNANDEQPEDNTIQRINEGPGSPAPAIVQLDDPARYMERVYEASSLPFSAKHVHSDVPYTGTKIQLPASDPSTKIWENIISLHTTDTGFCVAQLTCRHLPTLWYYHRKAGLPGFMHPPRQASDCPNSLKTI